MKANEIKNVFVITKTWRDNANGNTYFAQKIIVNMFEANEVTIINELQYGYSSFLDYALDAVCREFGFNKEERYKIERCAKFRGITQKRCLKRELVNIREF